MDENKIIEIQNRLLNDKQVLGLEITTKCNNNCYMCPRDNFKRKNLDMSIDTFKKFCEWIPEKCDIFIAGYGEPLLNNNLAYFINEFHKRKIETSVMTNGKLLSRKKINELFDNGLDRLQVSIILKDGIERINDITKLVCNNNKSRVEFNILYEASMNLPYKFVEELNNEGFKYSFKLIHNRGNELYNADWKHEIQTCGSFFILSDIDSDGNIKICSQDINGKYNIGNIFTMSFDEYLNYKKRFFGNKSIIPICKHCTDEYRLIHLHNYDNEQ